MAMKKKERGKIRLLIVLLLALAMTIVFIPSTVFADDDEDNDSRTNITVFYNDSEEPKELQNAHSSSQVVPGMTLKLKADYEEPDDDNEGTSYTYEWSCDTAELATLKENLEKIGLESDDKISGLNPDSSESAFITELQKHTTSEFVKLNDTTGSSITVSFEDVYGSNGLKEKILERGFCVKINVKVFKAGESEPIDTNSVVIDINDEYVELWPVDECCLENLAVGASAAITPKFYYRGSKYMRQKYNNEDVLDGFFKEASFKWQRGDDEDVKDANQKKIIASYNELDENGKKAVKDEYKKFCEDNQADFSIDDSNLDNKDWDFLYWYFFNELDDVTGDNQNNAATSIQNGNSPGEYTITRNSFADADLTLLAKSDVWPYGIDIKPYRIPEQDNDLSHYYIYFPDSKDGWRLYTDKTSDITINAQVRQGDTILPDSAYDLIIEKESFDDNDNQHFSDPITNGSIALDNDREATFIVYAEARIGPGYTGTAGVWKNPQGEIDYTYLNIFYNKNLAGADVSFNADKADINTPMFDLYTVTPGTTPAPSVAINGTVLSADTEYSVAYIECDKPKDGGQYQDEDGNTITNYFLKDKEGAHEFAAFPTAPGYYRCIVKGKGNYEGRYDRTGFVVPNYLAFEDFSYSITGGTLTADGSDLASKVVLSAVANRPYTNEITTLLNEKKIVPVFLPAASGESDYERKYTLTEAGAYWMWAGWSTSATDEDKAAYRLPMSPLAATIAGENGQEIVGGGNIVVNAPAPSGGGSGGSGTTPEEPAPTPTTITDTDSSAEVTATIADGEAVVAPISTADLENVNDGDKISMDVSKAATGAGAEVKDVTSITMTTDSVKNLANSSAGSVEIKLDSATATLDDKTLDALADQAKGNDVNLTVEKDKLAEATMTKEQKETASELNNPLLFEVTLSSGGNQISNLNGGTLTLQIAFMSSLQVRAWYLPDAGDKEATTCSYNGVIATVTLVHCSHYALEEYQTLNNTMTVKALTKKAKPVILKASKVKKAKQNIAAKRYVTVKNAKGDVTFSKISGKSAFKVNVKTGKITVKKGTKKGTYKVKIKVAASGEGDYLPAKKMVNCWIKVK